MCKCPDGGTPSTWGIFVGGPLSLARALRVALGPPLQRRSLQDGVAGSPAAGAAVTTAAAATSTRSRWSWEQTAAAICGVASIGSCWLGRLATFAVCQPIGAGRCDRRLAAASCDCQLHAAAAGATAAACQAAAGGGGRSRFRRRPQPGGCPAAGRGSAAASRGRNNGIGGSGSAARRGCRICCLLPAAGSAGGARRVLCVYICWPVK